MVRAWFKPLLNVPNHSDFNLQIQFINGAYCILQKETDFLSVYVL